MGVRTKMWTREEYGRLVAAGYFSPEARVQLVQGEIVEVSPQGPAHATAVRLVQQGLAGAFGERYDVRPQLPLALSGFSEPEPDVSVVAGAARDYRNLHPATAVLVVEIADSTLDFDRTRKLAMYAESGVPEYWVLNLLDRVLEVFREPREGTYRAAAHLRAGESISPLAAPGARIMISALLP